MGFSGKQKLHFVDRLGDDWRRLSTLLEIPAERERRFTPGDEARGIWQWLEERDALHRLPQALREIGRDDLADHLQTPPDPKTSPPGLPAELRVRLSIQGGELLREYATPQTGKRLAHRAAWQPVVDGESLFETLFGASHHSQAARLLQEIHGPEAVDECAAPHWPLRVLLCTDNDDLARLPWRRLAWEDQALVEDCGWTVAFLAQDRLHGRLQDHVLEAPCRVLLIAPQVAGGVRTGRAIHPRALAERLDRLWPHHAEPPTVVSTWDDATLAFHPRRPGIVEVLAAVRRGADGVELVWETDTGDAEHRPLADLPTLWADTGPPDLLILNLIGLPDVGAACAPVVGGVPVTLVQCDAGEKAGELRQRALTFLGELLSSAGAVDPARLAALHAHPTAQLWVACQRLRVECGNLAVTTIREPHLVLDRSRQRAAALQALKELVHERKRRLCGLIAYGGDGSMVNTFSDQLYAHLRTYANEALVWVRDLWLPPMPDFEVAELETQVRRDLKLDDRAVIGEALARQRVSGSGRRQSVLLLNWQLRGIGRGENLGEQGLRAWLRFCAGHLAQHCPPTLRILSCLKLEGAQEHAAVVRHVLHDEIARGTASQERCLRLELLDPLDDVTAADLANFLGGGHTSCPDQHRVAMPALILRRTGGHFADTVKLIRQAEAGSWYELHDELSREPATPGPTPPPPEWPR